MGGGPLCEYPPEFLHNGIYLPVLLDPEECCSSPIVLGYTAGHFSAVVAMAAGAQPNPVSEVQSATMSSLTPEELATLLEGTPACREAANPPDPPPEAAPGASTEQEKLAQEAADRALCEELARGGASPLSASIDDPLPPLPSPGLDVSVHACLG